MADKAMFEDNVKQGYSFKGIHFQLGAAMLDGEVLTGTPVFLPLKTMNRHGLIAGATGTGKTKTLQVLAEGLSNASVPVLMMDIKGDLSGLAAAGVINDKITERAGKIGITNYHPAAFPVELLSLSDEPGVRMRSTVSEFGPILLAKILGLNETQEGVVSMIFKYCDDLQMPLLDLKDFIKVLQFIGNEGKKELEASYGKISTSTTGTILRKVIELQQQGADIFFGEPSFDVNDLMRPGPDGRGMINILRVTDMQNRPKLFSTFMLGLLAELYASMPEEGDMDQPKLVLFIDEAHLIFQEATSALLQQIETVIKLIRSKGVGIFFCTQNPQDIPAPVLSQLGLKIQHALRAFTAADRKTIKTAAQNYPETSFYDVDEILTQMGIGEALVTLLNEKGIPTPLVHTYLLPPATRMDVLTDGEIEQIVRASSLVSKYAKLVDAESAYEILTAKLVEAARVERENEAEEQSSKTGKKAPKEESIFDNTVVRQAGRTAASIITRSLLGALGLSGTSRKRKKGLFG
jgi:DNA helicase HerA-like ATPase